MAECSSHSIGNTDTSPTNTQSSSTSTTVDTNIDDIAHLSLPLLSPEELRVASENLLQIARQAVVKRERFERDAPGFTFK